MFRLRAPLSLVVAGLFLCSTTVLPALHEWSVGTSEATFHSQHSSSAGPVVKAGTGGHDHHSEETCRLCPLFFGSRQTAPHGGCAAGAPDLDSSLPGVASGPCTRTDEFGAAPRGPPTSTA